MLTATEHIWPVRNREEIDRFELETKETHQQVERALYRRLLEMQPEAGEDNPYCDRETFMARLRQNPLERAVWLKVQHRNSREVRAEFTEDLYDPYPGDDDPNGAGILEMRETPNGPCFIVELEDGTIRAEHGATCNDMGKRLPF